MNVNLKHYYKVNRQLRKLKFEPAKRNSRLDRISQEFKSHHILAKNSDVITWDRIKAIIDNAETDLLLI